jgi:hypothetical protein
LVFSSYFYHTTLALNRYYAQVSPSQELIANLRGFPIYLIVHETVFTPEQEIGLQRLKELGFENLDPAKLKFLSELHQPDPDIRMEYIEPIAREKIEMLQASSSVDIRVGVGGSALGNWMLMSALNSKLSAEDQRAVVFSTDIDVFVLYDEKGNSSGETGTVSIKTAEEKVKEFGPPFCNTFNPSGYNFNNIDFGLGKISDPVVGKTFDMYFKPHQISSSIVSRANQIRLLEHLYRDEQNPNLQGMVAKYEEYIDSLADTIQARLDAGRPAEATYWYKDSFLKDMAEQAGLPEGTPLKEIFRALARTKQPLISPVKEKHILRAGGKDEALKQKISGNMAAIKEVLKTNFGLNFKG